MKLNSRPRKVQLRFNANQQLVVCVLVYVSVCKLCCDVKESSSFLSQLRDFLTATPTF